MLFFITYVPITGDNIKVKLRIFVVRFVLEGTSSKNYTLCTNYFQGIYKSLNCKLNTLIRVSYNVS